MRKTSAIIFTSMLMATSFASAAPQGQADPTAVANALIANEIQNAKANGPEWLKRTDIQFSLERNSSPSYTLESVQPFHKTDREATFYQIRFNQDSDVGLTTNFGVGYRTVSEDKNRLYGINSFYDQSWRYNHKRVGLGAEYFVGKLEFRANGYRAITGEKVVDAANQIYERALSGYDYEVGGVLPDMPYAKLYAGGYTWDYKHSDDAKGYRVRTELQLTPQFSLEAVYAHDNHQTSAPSVSFLYTLGASDKVSLFGSDKKAIEEVNKAPVDQAEKLLEKVRRENQIKVERYAKVGNVTISVIGGN